MEARELLFLIKAVYIWNLCALGEKTRKSLLMGLKLKLADKSL